MTTRVQAPRALVGGSILVAALSSACCWLPLLAVALGFSAVGVGSIVETYRWPLIALAVGLIVGGMVLQRRRRHACEHDGCPPPRRHGLPLLLGGLFVVAFPVFPVVLAWTAPGAAAHAAPASATMTRTYSVTGMTCEGCTSLLDSYLEDQPEIARASIIYAEASARVEFVAGTTAAQADRVMDRVSVDWEGKYRFTADRSE